MEENTELNLDTSSIKQREGITTSSLTDRNQVPVFSDAFQDVVEQRNEETLAEKENIIKHVFSDDLSDVESLDVRTQMFLNTNTELVIRNDAAQNSVQSVVEILSALIMAGMLMAIMVAYYGKKRKGERHADNHNKKRR